MRVRPNRIIPARILFVTTKEGGRDDACPLYSCCLTDEQWQVIEPLLPVARRGRPRVHSLRRVLDTIWYVLRTGCAWRLIPNDLVAWYAAYRCFRSWTRQGVWADIHDALRDQVRTAAGRNPAPTAAVLDSQTVQSSEGGEQIGWDQGNYADLAVILTPGRKALAATASGGSHADIIASI